MEKGLTEGEFQSFGSSFPFKEPEQNEDGVTMKPSERRFFFLSLQKSSLMFKRLDASTLPEDILSDSQSLPMMAHSAGSAL